MSRERLLARVPDRPAWVETRALLLDSTTDLWIDPGGAGFAVADPAEGLIAAAGPAAAELVGVAAAASAAAATVVVQRAESAAVTEALPGWRSERAVVFAMPLGVRPAARCGARARWIETLAVDDLSHLPRRLRVELELALARSRPLVAAVVEERAVSFCYAARQTETLWDVSVETLETYRRRGLAGACAARLIGRLRQQGLQPVWGAVESNIASRRLATRLGFEAVDRIVVIERV